MKRRKIFRALAAALGILLTILIMFQFEDVQDFWDMHNPFASPPPKKEVAKTKVAMRTLEIYFFDWFLKANSEDQILAKVKKHMTGLGTYFESVSAHNFGIEDSNYPYVEVYLNPDRTHNAGYTQERLYTTENLHNLLQLKGVKAIESVTSTNFAKDISQDEKINHQNCQSSPLRSLKKQRDENFINSMKQINIQARAQPPIQINISQSSDFDEDDL